MIFTSTWSPRSNPTESALPDDFDKKEWQAAQAERDKAAEKQREKDEKSRERKARNAKRKLERLARDLAKKEDLTEWETEFAQGVSERLDKFGSAFADPEKGGRGEALSYAQKKVVSSLKKKAAGKDSGEKSGFKPRSSFKSKKPKFSPRVRQLDEDFAPDDSGAKPEAQTSPQSERPPKGKPFLRIVRDD